MGSFKIGVGFGTQPSGTPGEKTRSGSLKIRFRGFHRRRDAAMMALMVLSRASGWVRRARDACGGWAGSIGGVEADRRALAGTVG